MQLIKKLIRKLIPDLILDYYSWYKYTANQSPFHDMDIGAVFNRIYESNYWGSSESVSGPGSSQSHAGILAEHISNLLTKLNIQSIVDAPCGDFNWIRHLDLSKVDYTGVDIVPALIEKNITNYSQLNIKFLTMDLVKDPLPRADLIINRDCLVHFSYAHIHKALNNMIRSGSTYLMTTSFPRLKVNYNITTGDWRPINLEIPPFRFPRPLFILTEPFEKKFEKENKGKILGIWRLNELSKHLGSDAYQLN